jgi:hypothetical protein
MAMKGKLEYTYGCYSASGGKDDMRIVHQGRLDLGLTCRKWWLHPMPKAAMTHYNTNNSSPRSVISNLP